MDIIFFNSKIILIDYLRNREFQILKNQGSFLRFLHSKNNSNLEKILFKLNYYSVLKKKIIFHPYELFYSSRFFIDYSNANAVIQLENEADKKYQSYKESSPNIDSQHRFYFLNPIIYKKYLTNLNKVGALLYFCTGVKCSATFNSKRHIKKYIPSNGARYPFKALLYINKKINNLPQPGVYEYDMRTHALISLPSHPQNTNITSDPFVLVFYADITRVMSRYPNGIAYRDLLFDYGHFIAMLHSCINHYRLNEHIEIIDIQPNELIYKNIRKLLDLPFVQIKVNIDFFNS